ncbi:hypothetical protein [Tamaricihabitans halophyticus]|nr:hypothetical protein [Tamaricihabitans halophyticus]
MPVWGWIAIGGLLVALFLGALLKQRRERKIRQGLRASSGMSLGELDARRAEEVRRVDPMGVLNHRPDPGGGGP